MTLNFELADISLSDEDIPEAAVSQSLGVGRLSQTNSSVRDWAGFKQGLGKERKPRRKSLEEMQKEELEDRKFLESCREKILGKSETKFRDSTDLKW